MKYGRTTKSTRGKIVGINAILNVTYDSGNALFENQIVIVPKGPFSVFSDFGDSGSLVVKAGRREPVGLLFAISDDGFFTFANPIDAVLSRFSVTVDGD